MVGMMKSEESYSGMALPLLSSTQIDPNGHDSHCIALSPRCLKIVQSMKGIMFGIFAAISFAVADYWIRVVQEVGGVGPLQTTFYLNIGMSICVIPIIIYKSINIVGKSYKELGILITIAALYLGSSFTLIKALLLGPIGNVTGILRGTMPIITPILSMIVLRESLHIVDGIVTVVNICGILLMAQPPEIFGTEDQFEAVNSLEMFAYGLAIFTGVQLSLCIVIVRYLGENSSALVILCWVSIIGSVISLIFTLVIENPKWTMDLEMSLTATGMVIATLLGTVCRLKSLQLTEATPIVLLANIQIVVAFLLQTYGLLEIPDIYSILGTSIILLGAIVCAVNTWWRDYQLKKKCPYYDM
ncbi:solute carrier family 35 member G1-like [Saccoglossus kowalevskii]|uniref:Uncharacterized protein LOC102803599 n=1 Tax=Saccoglossus kowalevskii TaxID=10224 RepID=A0ABM0MWS2_SACKO|nr:PREDICTED: uncharacterized protein LOC102803599 [Saccoglossus kowalevskii]